MKKIVKVAFAFIALLFSALPSYAIECNGRYQVLKNGSEIVTPYCSHSFLAEVAREYGYSYSNRQVRKSFKIKKDLCENFGHDSRLSDICSSFLDNSRARGL